MVEKSTTACNNFIDSFMSSRIIFFVAFFHVYVRTILFPTLVGTILLLTFVGISYCTNYCYVAGDTYVLICGTVAVVPPYMGRGRPSMYPPGMVPTWNPTPTPHNIHPATTTSTIKNRMLAPTSTLSLRSVWYPLYHRLSFTHMYCFHLTTGIQ